MRNTRDYGKNYNDGGAVDVEDTVDDQAVGDLKQIQENRAGRSTRGPEAQAFGIDKLHKKREQMNRWFRTPGMDDAGASWLTVGPKTDI